MGSTHRQVEVLGHSSEHDCCPGRTMLPSPPVRLVNMSLKECVPRTASTIARSW